MSRLFGIAAISLILPGMVAAEHRRGGMPAGGHVAISAPHAAAARTGSSAAPRVGMRVQSPGTQAARVGSVARTHAGGIRTTRRANVVPFERFGGTDFQDVPGLGFDFPHLAAISGNRRPHGRNFGGAFPLGFNGFLLGAPSVIVEEPQPEGQQPEAEEAMAENVAEPVRLGRSRSARTAGSSPVSRGAGRDGHEGGPPKEGGAIRFGAGGGKLVFFRRF